MDAMNEKYWVYWGASGWEYGGWQGGFYPEDLPHDWLLSFYNTQFRAVWLPVSLWEKASNSAIQQWLEDTQEGFRFLIEVEPGVGEAARQCVEKLAGRGILATPEWCEEHVVWLAQSPDLRVLAARISKQAGEGKPLFIISRDGDLKSLNRVRELTQIMGH